jgi:hypothetical protein
MNKVNKINEFIIQYDVLSTPNGMNIEDVFNHFYETGEILFSDYEKIGSIVGNNSNTPKLTLASTGKEIIIKKI